MRLLLFGHMTVWVELDGVCFLTDPWFGPHGRLERWLAPRTIPPAVDSTALSGVQALLASHHHLDHLDGFSLTLARLLGWKVIGSEAVAARARRAGVTEAIALRPGQSAVLGHLRVEAVPAEHPLAADAIGFLVRGSRTLYFSGDTRATAAVTGAITNPVDVALVQAACAHYLILGDDGMSLSEAAALLRAVRPRWFVPLHLHCSGKWLDRRRGLRIRSDNATAVRAALGEWLGRLADEGLYGKLLEPGELVDVEG